MNIFDDASGLKPGFNDINNATAAANVADPIGQIAAKIAFPAISNTKTTLGLTVNSSDQEIAAVASNWEETVEKLRQQQKGVVRGVASSGARQSFAKTSDFTKTSFNDGSTFQLKPTVAGKVMTVPAGRFFRGDSCLPVKDAEKDIFVHCSSCSIKNCPNKGKAQDKLTLYQSAKLPGQDGNGNIAPDMTCGDLSYSDLSDLYKTIAADLNDKIPDVPVIDGLAKEYAAEHNMSKTFQLVKVRNLDHETLFKQLRDLGEFFSAGNLEGVVTELIDRFESGSGEEYSSEKLTKEMKNHINTQNYIHDFLDAFHAGLLRNFHDLQKTAVDQDFKDITAEKLTRPKFNRPSDTLFGLTMIANDTHGMRVDVKEFIYCGRLDLCQGILQFDIYDHFGLNVEDVRDKIFGHLEGFTAWLALQHYDGFQQKFNPFITRAVIDHPFRKTHGWFGTAIL
jgi:uncharacterized protein (TIGR03034 family)